MIRSVSRSLKVFLNCLFGRYCTIKISLPKIEKIKMVFLGISSVYIFLVSTVM